MPSPSSPRDQSGNLSAVGLGGVHVYETVTVGDNREILTIDPDELCCVVNNGIIHTDDGAGLLHKELAYHLELLAHFSSVYQNLTFNYRFFASRLILTVA